MAARQLTGAGVQGAPPGSILHLPLRYADETRLTPIGSAEAAGEVVIEGEVSGAEVVYRPRRQLVVTVDDGTGRAALRYFHFWPGQQKALVPGARVRAAGELRAGLFGAEMIHPRWRVVRPGTPLPETLTPVYPAGAGTSQQRIRREIEAALAAADLADTVDAATLRRLGLPGFADSVRLLHAPPPGTDLEALAARSHPAWRRIKFDELLAQQLSMRVHRRRRAGLAAPALAAGAGSLSARLERSLPFALTGAQRRALDEILADLARPVPMQRLLQGDVGSGKTIVAALAAARAVENGVQVAAMAPTELLAEQTYRRFAHWLEPLGVRCVWLAGSMRRTAQREALAGIASGEVQLAAGTHALFQQRVSFARLGLAIVDEQHRFGVGQRLALRNKAALAPDTEAHLLMMSATPIPRTLAMSYYADLDVSAIDRLPPGRSPVETRLVAYERRDEVIARVREACAQGRQAYWVCPLVEESEALDLETATDTYQALRARCPELAIGLVHGRLPAADKAAVMQAFARGELRLLVATTVIEVGVDVPNASLMVIDHAERMGLAQLHQLRGRVGRGGARSSCALLYLPPLSALARERLRVIRDCADGFEIARHDLRLRGPGELLGARQSGVPMLRFADPEADAGLLEAAREVAARMLEGAPAAVERHLARWLPDAAEYLKG